MCGRFTLLQSENKIQAHFKLDQPIKGYRSSYNIAPSENVIAIIYDEKRNEKRAGPLKWGLVPSWARDPKIGNNMINARSETAHEKPSFKHLMAHKRCLIIADSFYEWKTDETRQPQRIKLKDRSLFAFAGLWDKWQMDGKVLFTCTMLTTDANDFMRSIHHRMPIILPKEKEDEWIKPSFNDAKEAQQFIRSIEIEPLTAYAVSTHVNHVKNDDERCIKPIESL